MALDTVEVDFEGIVGVFLESAEVHVLCLLCVNLSRFNRRAGHLTLEAVRLHASITIMTRMHDL